MKFSSKSSESFKKNSTLSNSFSFDKAKMFQTAPQLKHNNQVNNTFSVDEFRDKSASESSLSKKFVQNSEISQSNKSDLKKLDLNSTIKFNLTKIEKNNNFIANSFMTKEKKLRLDPITYKGSSINYISDSQVVDIQQDKLKNENTLIFDCRFSYEYDGGHITDAISFLEPPEMLYIILNGDYQKIFYSKKSLEKLKSLKKLDTNIIKTLYEIAINDDTLLTEEPSILFYCEFSSARAPSMYNTWRNIDRDNNVFPKLKYPNIYVLKDGYCNFVETYPEFCSNNGSYIKMNDNKFASEMSECFKRRKDFKQTCSISQSLPENMTKNIFYNHRLCKKFLHTPRTQKDLE